MHEELSEDVDAKEVCACIHVTLILQWGALSLALLFMWDGALAELIRVRF
jgi:hypothetical protein